MAKYEGKDFKVGNYVYYTDGINRHIVGKIMELEEMSDESCTYTRIWAHWSRKPVSELPRTLKQFDAIEKCEGMKIAINGEIQGFLSFDKVDTVGLIEKLSKLDSYNTNTIMALQEILGEKYGFEDILKLLIPNIIGIIEE